MHARNLAARNEEARRRIAVAASILADALQIEPLDHPTPVEQRQFEVAQMRELEHLADLLERVTGELAHGNQAR